MWNIVKENERKRKQKMLKDRVNLQHQMIKKQDELIEEKYEQQKMVSMNSALLQTCEAKHFNMADFREISLLISLLIKRKRKNKNLKQELKEKRLNNCNKKVKM
jgi:GTPase SAR1 family protein